MNDVLKKDLADMLATFEPGAGTEVNTDPPSTSAPGTDSPSTDAPGTDAPGTDSPSTDAPGTSAPATDAPTTAAPDDEDDDRFTNLKAENELLKSRLDKLEKDPTTDAPGTTAPTTAAPVEAQDFLGDIDLDELTRDKDQFNALLNKVLKSGVDIGRTEIRQGNERVLLATPEVARKNVEIVLALKEASDKFYTDNEDLKPFKKVVSTVMEEAMAKNPDKPYADIMDDVAVETRERLELVKKAEKKGNPSPKLPKAKGQNKGNRQKPKATALESEIDQMNTALTEDS